MTFSRPINDPSPRVTGPYGTNHRGIDYGYPDTTPIYASADGTVRVATNHYLNSWRGVPPLTTRDYGNMLKIDHGGGWSTLYAHLKKDSLVVSVGSKVKKGQLIARVGSTGNSTGNHLHWEVRLNEVTQNPAPILDTSFTAYGGVPPLGGEGNMDGLQACMIDREKFWAERDEARAEVESQKGTIAHLNDMLGHKEREITTLKAEQKTLETQLEEAIKQRDIYEIDAMKIPELTAERNDATESRQGYIDENVMLTQTIERERREHKAELDTLLNDAPRALVRWVMRIVTGGGK